MQNADATINTVRRETGNSKPDIFLVSYPHAGNVISELIVAGYEQTLSSIFGYSTPVNNMVETLNNAGANVTAIGHSRGSIVLRNALQQMVEQGIKNDELQVQVKGPAISQEQITEVTGQLRTSDRAAKRNSPEYSSFPNDLVSTLIGHSPNGELIPSLLEVNNLITSPTSAHSCYGTGAPGCWQIEKPYSYDGLSPEKLQQIRQQQVDQWMRQGTPYDPLGVIKPVNGLLPLPIYFQKNPVWDIEVLVNTSSSYNDKRIKQLSR